MECLPIIITEMICIVKLLNHIIHKGKFEMLFVIMKEEWDMLNPDEKEVLDKITKQGSKLTNMYRTSLFSFSIIFALFPLLPQFLDFVSPLNETRSRHLVVKVDYVFDVNQHFTLLYLYMVWCSYVTMMVIISIDALYVLIVHHTCGLFAVCGYQIQKATEDNGPGMNGNSNYEFKKCVMLHVRALESYDIINGITSRSYFFQVGLNMVNISITSVQTVMYLHQPEEVSRLACFLVAQQFHLLFISLPGQIIMDQSTKLTYDIYNSMWYNIPVKIQKILHQMQIRSSKPCKLVAGGLYEMTIQNFGITFKTCMSYFTMLLSLKD
ncbi:hypothetical protein ANTPLA_LOCUS8691 [Anthophora plagiata]